MPARKKAAVKKKTAKKASKKPVMKKKAAKKTAKETSKKKKATIEKPKPEKPIAVEPRPVESAIETPPEIPGKEKSGIDCEHCNATGVCAAGTPYDKTRGQMFGAQPRLTSCVDCLLAAGEHKNSKKLVDCRICGGDGKV